MNTMNTTAQTALIFVLVERRFTNGIEQESTESTFFSQDELMNARDARIARLILRGFHYDDNQDDGVGYTWNRADGVYHIKLEGYSRVAEVKTTKPMPSSVRTCEACGGSGLWRGQFKTGKCFKCDGTGQQAKKKDYQLDMPTRSGFVVTPPAPQPAEQTEIKEATYTVVGENLKHGRRTIKVHAVNFGGEEKLTVSFLSGGNNEGDYIKAAFIDKATGRIIVWKKFRGGEFENELIHCINVVKGDPRACMEAYALVSNRCACCHRKLTVPTSIHRGLGPDCAAKLGY